MLLTTPLARAQWAIRSGLGVFAAIALMTAIIALAVGIGAAIAGSDALTPMTGSITLGLYAAGLAGVGFAVGGLFRTTIAAEIVALVVIAMYLIDLLAPAMKLPDLVHQLALTAHLGQPMVGACGFRGCCGMPGPGRRWFRARWLGDAPAGRGSLRFRGRSCDEVAREETVELHTGV